MVRVGGGWTALDEFLVRHDPCRGKIDLHLLFLDHIKHYKSFSWEI
jgi:hypothetical protein